ncbi:MAG: hypothetical protein QOF98_2997, partial [Streptomyces sp.]|nr:hypothetical protein [Streptomyces sp.]
QAAGPLLTMCLRYTHAVRHGRQPDAESAEQLRLAAGGTDRIGPYCRGLVAAAEAGKNEQGQNEQGKSESGKNDQGRKPHTPGSAKRP